jgi:hypothetical protein
VVTVEAEDSFDFPGRLAEIAAPTLVVTGEDAPFHAPHLFRETAAGIPRARLVLYPRMGHPAAGKQFERDVLIFLCEEGPPEGTPTAPSAMGAVAASGRPTLEALSARTRRVCRSAPGSRRNPSRT